MQGQRNLFKVNDRYGKLTIVEAWTEKNMNMKEPRKESMCKCKCDCGKEIVAWGRYVRNGHKKSCGCMVGRKGSDNPNWKGYGEISSSSWSRIIKGAKNDRSREIEFDITIKQGWELFFKQNRLCALTGLPIKFPSRSRCYGAADSSASLDRIDSTKGYTIDNIQWVHKIVNLMKCDLDQDQFIRWCRRISDYNHNVPGVNHEAEA
jgi:hypothetical protein